MANIFKKGLFASIAVIFHKIFPAGKVSSASIVNGAEEIAACVNFGREVYSDVKAAGNDPAKITEALATSIKAHIKDVPAALLTPANVTEISSVCSEICGEPLDSIEAIIKAELGIK